MRFCISFLISFLQFGLAYDNWDYELLKAAEIGDTDRVAEVLDKGAVIDCRNNFGVSPLIWLRMHFVRIRLVCSRLISVMRFIV